jgi:surface polysaccharide O-acyltransferase-like enzyme
MNKQNGISTRAVDLIRVIAIVGVIMLHAANSDFTSEHVHLGLLRWLLVDIYQCVGRVGVPLFLMLTGALLLAPSKKDEDIGVFFKKRFSRIGLPFIFWSVIYFLWAFYVENQPFTQDFIINGILKGPHFILWYLYMLVGLYLITPLLRVMVSSFTSKHFQYFICLWAIGLTLMNTIEAVGGGHYYLYGGIFLIPECVGYYVIGVYLANMQIRRRLLVSLTVLGLSLTAILTCVLSMYHTNNVFFFQNYFSPTLILTSLPLFMLLNSYAKSKDVVQIEKPHGSNV